LAQSRKELNLQASYDLGSARAMFQTGRYIYAVFMCHLAIEKALKGLYIAMRGSGPPKTHDVVRPIVAEARKALAWIRRQP